MSDDPNAHESLVAKHQRRSGLRDDMASYSRDVQETSYGSLNNLPETESQPLTPLEERRTPCISCIEVRCYLLEPMILILLFAYNFSSTILKNQIIYQTCTAIFGYNESDCKLLGTSNTSEYIKHIETEVQPYAARITMTMSIVQSVLQAFFGIFIGSWSDRYGRKPLLLTAFTGFSLQYVFSAVIAYIATQHFVSPWYYVLTIIPLSSIGGSITYSVAAFCFIADVSTPQTRSYRMMIYEICVYMGLLLGAYLSGYVYEATNSVYIFSISATAIIFAVLIMAIFLPESLPPANPDVHETNANQLRFNCASICELLKDLWSTCIKPRLFNDRAIIILVMCTLLITAFTSDGNNSVFYLFIREKFHWSVREFTTYESISILVPAVAGYGGLLFLWLLRKCSNSAVILLAIISLLSHTSSSLMKAFAIANWQIYSAVGLGVFKSMGNPMCNTIITNLVPADERGKILSLLSVLKTFLPSASSAIYTLIYSITISSFPGFFNLVSGNLYFLAIILLLVVYRKKMINPEYYENICK